MRIAVAYWGGGVVGGCLCICIHPGHTEQKPREVCKQRVLSVESLLSAMWPISTDFVTNVLHLEVNLGSQFCTVSNMPDVRTWRMLFI